ncbi:hypothetical protein [Mesorhizobium sp. SARCC-RB16n]|uniref:hypothetical protein n=1 Tax=Mesorhizobium sp. SARCC-RB16n TaxID=2116687 RepID=UPI001667AB77|nr:hypothetical protein [Mesorhizobium sp. SARCC-RB16n]
MQKLRAVAEGLQHADHPILGRSTISNRKSLPADQVRLTETTMMPPCPKSPSCRAKYAGEE